MATTVRVQDLSSGAVADVAVVPGGAAGGSAVRAFEDAVRATFDMPAEQRLSLHAENEFLNEDDAAAATTMAVLMAYARDGTVVHAMRHLDKPEPATTIGGAFAGGAGAGGATTTAERGSGADEVLVRATKVAEARALEFARGVHARDQKVSWQRGAPVSLWCS